MIVAISSSSYNCIVALSHRALRVGRIEFAVRQVIMMFTASVVANHPTVQYTTGNGLCKLPEGAQNRHRRPLCSFTFIVKRYTNPIYCGRMPPVVLHAVLKRPRAARTVHPREFFWYAAPAVLAEASRYPTLSILCVFCSLERRS
jgi:hypothetical protein